MLLIKCDRLVLGGEEQRTGCSPRGPLAKSSRLPCSFAFISWGLPSPQGPPRLDGSFWKSLGKTRSLLPPLAPRPRVMEQAQSPRWVVLQPLLLLHEVLWPFSNLSKTRSYRFTWWQGIPPVYNAL